MMLGKSNQTRFQQHSLRTLPYLTRDCAQYHTEVIMVFYSFCIWGVSHDHETPLFCRSVFFNSSEDASARSASPRSANPDVSFIDARRSEGVACPHSISRFSRVLKAASSTPSPRYEMPEHSQIQNYRMVCRAAALLICGARSNPLANERGACFVPFPRAQPGAITFGFMGNFHAGFAGLESTSGRCA
jgi:hypothetical protein